MKKFFIRKWKISLILLILSIFLAIFFLNKEKNDVAYIYEVVKKGDIFEAVIASGEIEAKTKVDVGAQVSGQIKQIFVNTGDEVKKGDLIAIIDDVKQQNEISDLNASLNILKAELASKEISLKIAKSKMQRENLLYKKGASSKENYENALNSYKLAEANLITTKQNIKKTEISLNTAQTNLGYTKIISPVNGTIISKLVEVGQTVNSNQTTPTIVTIANLDLLEVKIEISEGDITKIKNNQDVIFNILSDFSTNHKAKIYLIDPAPKNYNNTNSQNPTSAVYYYAKYLIDNKDRKFRIGMTTENKILINEAKQVNFLPSIAIQSDENGKFVIRQNLDKQEKIYIQTGLDNGINTQILSGLNEGDKIISQEFEKGQMRDLKMRFR